MKQIQKCFIIERRLTFQSRPERLNCIYYTTSVTTLPFLTCSTRHTPYIILRHFISNSSILLFFCIQVPSLKSIQHRQNYHTVRTITPSNIPIVALKTNHKIMVKIIRSTLFSTPSHLYRANQMHETSPFIQTYLPVCLVNKNFHTNMCIFYFFYFGHNWQLVHPVKLLSPFSPYLKYKSPLNMIKNITYTIHISEMPLDRNSLCMSISFMVYLFFYLHSYYHRSSLMYHMPYVLHNPLNAMFIGINSITVIQQNLF